MRGCKTIPLFPKYAINENKEVFNTITNKKMTPKILSGTKYYTLQRNKKRVKSTAKDLYICAYQRFDLLETLSTYDLATKKLNLKAYNKRI